MGARIGSETVAVVLYGQPVRSVGVDWDGYDVVREGQVWEGDRPITSVKVMREEEVLGYLEENDVEHERVYDTVVLRGNDAYDYLALELEPDKQDWLIGRLTGHPSARVEGHMTDVENEEIAVEYTHIPGL